jgi:hypothetical protein
MALSSAAVSGLPPVVCRLGWLRGTDTDVLSLLLVWRGVQPVPPSLPSICTLLPPSPPVCQAQSGPVRFTAGVSDLLASMQAGLRAPSSRAAGGCGGSSDRSGSSAPVAPAAQVFAGAGAPEFASNAAAALGLAMAGDGAGEEAQLAEDGGDALGARKRRSIVCSNRG